MEDLLELRELEKEIQEWLVRERCNYARMGTDATWLDALQEYINEMFRDLSFSGSSSLLDSNQQQLITDFIPKPLVLDANGDNLRSEKCAICDKLYRAGEEIMVLPKCKHDFHVHCFTAWSLVYDHCRVCRRLIHLDRFPEN